VKIFTWNMRNTNWFIWFFCYTLHTQNLKPPYVSRIYSTIGKYCSIQTMATFQDFIQRLKSLNHLVQQNIQYHRKVPYLSVAFIWMVILKDFIHRHKIRTMHLALHTLYVIHTTVTKYCPGAFSWMATLRNFKN